MKTIKILFVLAILSFLPLAANAQSPYDYNKGELVFCDNTDDNVNPINVLSSAGTSSPVNFCVKFPTQFKDDGNQVVVFAFEVYKVSDSGEEMHVHDFTMRMDTGYKRYATEYGYSFSEPGKYVVYCIDYRNIQQGYKLGNYEKYYAKNTITIN